MRSGARSGQETPPKMLSEQPGADAHRVRERDRDKRDRPGADESLAVWHRYKASGDVGLRNRLVLTYLPLVKHIAYKKLRELPACCELDDLISAGILSLMSALDRYDPGKGAALEPFLWTRIHGSVLDELRRRDWAPRSLRRLERDLADARTTFNDLHRRSPTLDELAAMVSMTPTEVRDKEREIEHSSLTSLNSLVLTEGEPTMELVDTLEAEDERTDPEQMAARQETKEQFRRGFGQLSEREREIAILLYVKELTMREVGEVMDVSESRISQIHGRLKARVRELAQAESSRAEAA